MKNSKSKLTFFLIGIVVFSALIVSCATESDETNNNNIVILRSQEQSSSTSIAQIVDGAIVLLYEKESILSKWQEDYAKRNGEYVTFLDLRIDEVYTDENEPYYIIRGFTEGFTETILLSLNSSFLRPEGVSCKSQACSNSTGCIPHWLGSYCTKCEEGAKDCEKTVTSDSFSLVPY